MPAWTPALDPKSGIVSVSSVNVGTANGGYRGDIVIGTFGELPDMSAGENCGVLADRQEASAFMVVNGMAVDNANPLDAYSTGGNGVDTRQAVTVTLDPSTVAAGTRGSALSLHRLNRRTGRPVTVPLERVGDQLRFTVEIDGGAGELFIWG